MASFQEKAKALGHDEKVAKVFKNLVIGAINMNEAQMMLIDATHKVWSVEEIEQEISKIRS